MVEATNKNLSVMFTDKIVVTIIYVFIVVKTFY